MNERERRRRPSLLGLEDDGRDLFGLAAHKLNTPIACLRGFVTTLLQRGDQLDAETVKQFHNVMLQQVDRLQGMVHNFLALARVQGGVEALAQPVRPRDLLVELLDDVGPEAGRVKGAGDLDVKVATDGELLRSALRPLVENALTYGPRRKPVTVTVSITGDRQRWEVRDAGSRLSQEELLQLFRPFTRANPAVERRGAGAGLGLSLARAYAEALHGQVGAKVDEQGTVFWLDLPAMAGEEMAS
jgi:two-component system, OmpR family, sensor histidine kinase BaeS